jgi:dihydropteroate synthase
LIIRKAAVYDFNDALKLVKATGCSARVCEVLAKKGILEPVTVENIDNRAANILKQEAISVGADAALSSDVSRFRLGFSNILLFATIEQISKLADKLILQPFGLKQLAADLKKLISRKKVFRYKDKHLNLDSPVVMGIVNLDPDSFSGDGLSDPGKALEQALEFERLGAGIIDIGAESSRPGVDLLDAETEIKRLLPALKKIRKYVKIPISVDTYKYETAKVALSEGADIINDIFSLRKGGNKLAELTADAKAGLILMHMKGLPADMQSNPEYKNCTSEVYEFLSERKAYAVKFGIQEDYIAVDPGPGFGKTVEHNMELVKNMSVFSALGAVVGAVSRKHFVKSLSGSDKTSFVAADFLAAFCGADILRVHDVRETVNVLKILETFRGI